MLQIHNVMHTRTPLHITPSHPHRTLPRSVLTGVPIVTVCYLLVNIAYFGVLCYDEVLDGDATALVRFTGLYSKTTSVKDGLSLRTTSPYSQLYWWYLRLTINHIVKLRF